MSTIVLRSVKGTPLTNTEVDTNFTNLNTDKLEAATSATLTNKTINLTSNTLVATSAQLASAVTDETGTGALVFANTPTLIAPALGTPTALVGTNITGTATNFTASNVTTNANLTGMVTSVGNATTVVTNANLTGAVTSSGNATSLGSFTSAQLLAALTDETGTGANVFATSPTLVTPALGTPSALVGTNITGTAANFNINGTVGATTPSTGNFTTLTENGVAVVTQSDIGSAPNEIPLNQYLGSLAYQNGDAYYNTGMTVGFRNRIINGNMVIDQRNAGAAVTASNSFPFSVDRWWGYEGSSGAFTMQQSSTSPTGFTKSVVLTVTTTQSSLGASDQYIFNQSIEGYNIADLAWGTTNAQPVTLSFWVQSSVIGTFPVALINGASNRSNVSTFTINNVNTWEYKTITFSGDTGGTWVVNNGIGLHVRLSLGAGSSFFATTTNSWNGGYLLTTSSCTNLMATSGATFYVTGVQLEKGNIATSFDVRPYGTELQLCLRYFQRIDGFYAVGFNSSTLSGSINFPVEMRASPSISVTGALETTDFVSANYTQSSGTASISGGGARVSPRGVMTDLANFSSITTYRVYGNLPQINRLTFSSEL